MFFERLIRLRSILCLFSKRQECPHAAFPYIHDRRVWHDDEEIFRHDVGGFGETFYEFYVFAYLDAHEIIELVLVCRFEGRDIRADIKHA